MFCSPGLHDLSFCMFAYFSFEAIGVLKLFRNLSFSMFADFSLYAIEVLKLFVNTYSFVDYVLLEVRKIRVAADREELQIVDRLIGGTPYG